MPLSVCPELSSGVVLCIDDNRDVLECERAFLESFGYTVLTASSGGKGLEMASIHSVDVVILDYFMLAMTGQEVAMEMRRLRPQAPIILLTEGLGVPEQTLNLVDALVAKDRLASQSLNARSINERSTNELEPLRRTILPRRLGPLLVRWLLSLLQLLLLPLVLLLQLLRLLLMALFYLLLRRVIRLLFIQIHVLLVLLLLEFVSFLLLLRDLLVLLLLVLLVLLGVARIWSAPCQGRKVVRMDGRAGSSRVVLCTPLISSAIGWSIRRSCRFGRYRATVIEISGPGCRCDAWLAHVRRRALLRVGSGCLRMLSLNRYRRDMSLTRRSLFLSRRTRADAAVAAVVTDAVYVVVDLPWCCKHCECW